MECSRSLIPTSPASTTGVKAISIMRLRSKVRKFAAWMAVTGRCPNPVGVWSGQRPDNAIHYTHSSDSGCTMVDSPNEAADDHQEAVRLDWESGRVPRTALLLGMHLGVCVVSAVSMMWAW